MTRIARHTFAAMAALLLTLVTIGEAVTVPHASADPGLAAPVLA